MTMTLQKLLCEYDVVTSVNITLEVENADGNSFDISLTAGRYRDMVAVAAELETQLDATITPQTWTVSIDNANGSITIASNSNFAVDWNTTTYDTTLRDDLGYDGTETLSGTNTLVSTACHYGGLYPSEPVEADDRPKDTDQDRWFNDAYQQIGRTGIVSTKGGRVRLSHRTITILLPQDDLSSFRAWMEVAGEGKSIAYYHDADVAWDGANNEYEEYHLLATEGEGSSYDPERVDPANDIWHRQTLQLRKRVASSA